MEPAIVLPKQYAESIGASREKHGTLDIKWSDAEQLALIDGFHIGFDKGGGRTAMSDLTRSWHALANAPTQRDMGLWYRVEPVLHAAGLQARIQTGAVDLDAFKQSVTGGWTTPAPTSTITVTCTTVEDDNGEEIMIGPAGLSRAPRSRRSTARSSLSTTMRRSSPRWLSRGRWRSLPRLGFS